ncbi:hypothetical protein DDZ13_08155 [Coraliomargarita sinensis]|uniref:Uncharacterized protein n=1 Tax=Coraliomargarita sinensis TaxID=2174842 RepID=A0A317ZJD1_9BACT|nr:toll/interleukin-1 receptor domain-containing protein [Coraliomargarita sinensis]PXA04008.1 hypothetical protein DDZ13_08155 [Coraliomargarita sinensis]
MTTKTEPDIFISHAVDDSDLIETLIDFLQTGLDIPAKRFFCSSSAGLGPKKGKDFLEVIKSQINSPALVISVVSKNYYVSEFCLCELGATWAMSNDHLPIVVPPLAFRDVQGVLKTTESTMINDETELDELGDAICETLGLGAKNTARWNSKKRKFLEALPDIIAKLPKPDKVSITDYETAQKELADSKDYISDLEEEKSQLEKKVEALKKCKNAEEVEEVEEEFDESDDQERFDALIKEVANCVGNFDKEIARFIIHNYFNKPYTPDFQTYQDEYDQAISSNYLVDSATDVNYENRKVSRLSDALDDLSSAMRGEVFSTEFVENYEDEYDINFEANNADFWFQHFGI